MTDAVGECMWPDRRPQPVALKKLTACLLTLALTEASQTRLPNGNRLTKAGLCRAQTSGAACGYAAQFPLNRAVHRKGEELRRFSGSCRVLPGRIGCRDRFSRTKHVLEARRRRQSGRAPNARVDVASQRIVQRSIILRRLQIVAGALAITENSALPASPCELRSCRAAAPAGRTGRRGAASGRSGRLGAFAPSSSAGA